MEDLTEDRNRIDQQNRFIHTLRDMRLSSEDHRIACCTVIGFLDNKSPASIASYYSTTRENVDKWWEYFGFDDSDTSGKPKRARKKGNIILFVQANFGRTVSMKEMADECGSSLPTIYNFYNANRHFFKKVSRGQFELINPDLERGKK